MKSKNTCPWLQRLLCWLDLRLGLDMRKQNPALCLISRSGNTKLYLQAARTSDSLTNWERRDGSWFSMKQASAAVALCHRLIP